MLSNYGRYIYEREGKSIIEDEFGFITYIFTETHCYIENIFVQSEYRRDGHGTRYGDEVTKLALQKGYDKLLGSVNLQTRNADESMKALLWYGFKPIKNENQMIYFEKELK